MSKFFAPQRLFAFAVFGLVILVAACRAPAPTSTPVPPTSNAPTALPPAPTAPPLTAAPTDIPPTAAPTAVLPTDAPATAVVPTDAAPPAATNTTTSGVATPIRPATAASGSGAGTGTGSGSGALPNTGPLAGLSISALRYDPTYPVKNTPIMFYATITNKTGKEQYYPICAEIFRPDDKKSIGITNCENLTMVPGTAEVAIGSWIATGIKECIPLRAHTVLREADEDDIRLVVPKADGSDLWVNFNMCP